MIIYLQRRIAMKDIFFGMQITCGGIGITVCDQSFDRIPYVERNRFAITGRR